MQILRGLLVGIVILFISPSQAQKSYVGVLGGLNSSDLKIVFEDATENDHDVQPGTAFSVGGLLGADLGSYWSVQVEPTYVVNRSVFSKPGDPELDLTTSIFELPLIIKLGIGEQIRPYLLAGGFMSFLLDADLEMDQAGTRMKGDLGKILKETDYGSVFGAGIRAPVWKGSAFLEGRYTLGMININKGGVVDLKVGEFVIPGPDTVPGDEIKRRSIQIMLGYQLPLTFK